jgi:hypothetical protein
MYLRRVIRLGVCVVVIGAVASVAIAYETNRTSPMEKFISCLVKHGWSIEQKPFTIPKNLRNELLTDWSGSPGYADSHSPKRGVGYELVVAGPTIDEANQGTLFSTAQAEPKSYQAVLVNYHAANENGDGSPDVVYCSFKVEPHQGA